MPPHLAVAPRSPEESEALKRIARVLALQARSRREARALIELASHIPQDASDEHLIAIERALDGHHYQSGVIALALGVSRTGG